jgi:hypothetical protein
VPENPIYIDIITSCLEKLMSYSVFIRTVMRKDPLKEALQKVSTLRAEGVSEKGITTLRKMTSKEAGMVVAKTAEVAAEWNTTELAQDLHDAFYRLSKDGVDTDPQCWGKTAIVKALYDLAWQDTKIFIAACKTVQLEPVYGGKGDSATGVRTAAIQALAQLPATDTLTVVNTLADLLADESPKVRAEAARACVYCQPLLVSPLLRLKIRSGDTEPRVLGVCFDTLLIISPESETVQLVQEYATPKLITKRFSPSHDVVQAEAIASLASSSLAEAINAASKLYPALSDTQLRRVLLTALGGSSATEAFNFLCQIVKEAPVNEAKWGLEALKPKLHDEEIRAQIEGYLKERNDTDLLRMYQTIKTN